MVQNVQPSSQSPSTNNPAATPSVRSAVVVAATATATATSPAKPMTKRQRQARSPMPDSSGMAPGLRPSLTNNTAHRKSGRKHKAKRRSVSQESQDDGQDLKTMGDENEISMDEEATARQKQTRPPSNWQLVRVEIPKEMAMLAGVNELININRNMVIDGVMFDGMIFFLFGDQIHEVNETIVNTRKQFEQAVTKHTAGTPLIITVIRAWNVRCPSYPVLNKLRSVDENCTYLVVRVHRFNRSNGGFSLGYIKKKVIITELRPKTKGSISFFLSDHLIGVLDPDTGMLFDNRPAERDECTYMQDAYLACMRKCGYVDFFVCRSRDADTSPNASIHGDLQTVVLKRDWGSEAPPTLEKKPSDVYDPPIESDAAGIALRELYRIRILTLTTDGGPIVVPQSRKGKSLLRMPPTIQAPLLPGRQPSNTNFNPTPSLINNSIYEKSVGVPQEKSLYEPYAKMPKPPALAKKAGSRWGRRQSQAATVRQSNITMKETHETSNILSDIPDEMKLKSVEPDSGVIGFIWGSFIAKKDKTKPEEKR